MNLLRKKILFPIYLLGFLFAFHVALPTYVNSSFLDTFIPDKVVGIIYMLSSAFTLFCFLVMPFILKEFGNYKTSVFLVVIDILALIGLAVLDSNFFLLLAFMVNLITIPLTYFLIDIFLEGYSANKETGLVRGVYLTAVNLAWTLSPLISGLILAGDFTKIYLASGLLMFPVLLILVTSLSKFQDQVYAATHIWQTAKVVWRNVNLRSIFTANFLLYFFYSWMVIYMPLYLNKHIGFDWPTIGLIFTVMLIPFVLVELPLGRLADKKMGEKELLSAGFILIAISTGIISFVTSGSIWVWMLILFLTRVGAAMIEIMCDTYFFKKVSGLNANVISFYRMSTPFAYVFGPLAATLLLNLFNVDIQYLFLILGIIMFAGLRFSLRIKDTR